jgi:hypothetical protein
LNRDVSWVEAWTEGGKLYITNMFGAGNAYTFPSLRVAASTHRCVSYALWIWMCLCSKVRQLHDLGLSWDVGVSYLKSLEVSRLQAPFLISAIPTSS